MSDDPAALVIRRADLSRSAPPKWAWDRWLVIGYLNLLIGNEGIGKGAFASWLIARLTQGELPGDYFGRPVAVGILGDEDSFDDVWVPRLHAQGANLELVVQIEGPDGGFVNVAADRERLGQVVLQHQIQTLFCDQLLDNLGAGTDDWRQKAVRDALQPIRALARELTILVLGTLHPNKRAETFRHLVSGAEPSTPSADQACCSHNTPTTTKPVSSPAAKATSPKHPTRSNSGSTNTASQPTDTTSASRSPPTSPPAHSPSTTS